MTTEPTATPNAWCIIRGRPGQDPLTIVGPFATADEANAYEAADKQEQAVPSMVDVLVAPANC